MRIIAFVLSVILFGLGASRLEAQAPKAVDEAPDFVAGRSFFWSGEYKQAEEKFKKVLSDQPDHEPSKDFLRMIEQSRRHDRSKIGTTRDWLQSIRIQKLDIKESDWRKIAHQLEAIANHPADGRKPEQTIYFINLLPSRFSRSLTVKVENVSLWDVIEKVVRQAELRVVVDTWALIFDIPKKNQK